MQNRLTIKYYVILCVTMVAGLGLSIGVGVATSSLFSPFGSASFDTTKGKTLFRMSCLGCHAEQQEVVGGLGPNLYNIGKVSSNRIKGVHPQDYILESILHPEAYRAQGASGHMPAGIVAGYPVEEVRSLVGYLASLGGVVDTEHLMNLKIDTSELEPKLLKINVTELKHGEDLFFNTLGCNGCHSIDGIPGSNLRAPSLAKAGLLSEEYIVSSIRQPSEVIADVWRMTKVRLKDGRIFDGRILSDDKSHMILLTTSTVSGGLLIRKTLSKRNIVSVTSAKKSMMPPYEITIRDEQALVAFLHSLVAEL